MHGEAMGNEEIAAARIRLGWTSPPFEIPEDIRAAWDMREKGARAEQEWRAKFAAYKAEFPALAAELERRMQGELPCGFRRARERASSGRPRPTASRWPRAKPRRPTLNSLGPSLPELFGGSADLTPSNGTLRKDSIVLTPESPAGNYVHFGVREFGMSAILNGITAHGGFIPYGGTFLTFSDYARNAVRMAALMRLRVIFVYTHDSIGLGEDGPTHQPIEQLASLRVIPHMDVWRPCDAVETATAWGLRHRQSRRTHLPGLDSPGGSAPSAPARAGGGDRARRLCACSIRRDRPRSSSSPPVRKSALPPMRCASMAAKGRKVRLVSMPSTTTFDRQDEAYKQSVLPPSVMRRVAVEAGAREPWWRYVGLAGRSRRHRSLRRVGAGEGSVQAVRVHARARGAGDRKGAAAEVVDSSITRGT